MVHARLALRSSVSTKAVQMHVLVDRDRASTARLAAKESLVQVKSKREH